MSVKEAWAADTDLGNRDPNNLNDHLKVTFEEVFGEPDHTHSIDCVWKYSFKCFNLWKTLCYLIATTLCGIPIASCWGCYFACVAFNHIWDCTPTIRSMEIECAMQRKILKICGSTFIEPCCESCGSLFRFFGK